MKLKTPIVKSFHKPHVLVVDSDLIDLYDEFGRDLAEKTGAVVICVPGGKIENLSEDDAVTALLTIMNRTTAS